MSTLWIDPDLLQLVGLGTKDDPYLQDGRHLRWFFGRYLGFPRAGFHLHRHRSPFDSAESLRKAMPFFRGESMASPVHQHYASGLELAGVADFADPYVTVPDAGPAPFLRIGKEPIVLRIGPPDPLPKPAIGPQLIDPAAYVVLYIARKETHGRVVAEAFYRSGTELKPLDRAGVGKELYEYIPFGAREHVVQAGRVQWLRSGAEQRMNMEQIYARHLQLEPHVRKSSGSGCIPFVKPEPWKLETLVLHGGLIQEIQITGADAALLAIQWLPTETYAKTDGWEPVGDYYLPLTDAPEIYPAWSGEPGESVAKDRLQSAPPRAFAPWDEPEMPPPAASPAAIAGDLQTRYLGGAFERIDEAMRTFLTGEIAELKPQTNIEVPTSLSWEGDGVQPPDVNIAFRPFDMLYGAAADPQMARLLGLMTTDQNEPEGLWDYYVGTAWPVIWLWYMLFPDVVETGMQAVRENRDATLFDELWQAAITLDNLGSDPLRMAERRFDVLPVISMATALQQRHSPMPAPPEHLKADVKPRPGAQIQAETEVTWDAPVVNLFEEPRRARIFYAVRRRGADGDATLNMQDDDTQLYLPIVPTGDAVKEGRAKLLDRSMRDYGPYTWEVSGMDIWGRFSPWATAEADVTDMVPPPPPTGVEAQLQGSAGDAPSWTSLVVSFNWTKLQEDATPDLEAFAVHVRQGKTKAGDSTVWGMLELTPGATATAPLRINAKTLDIESALPPGVTAEATLAPLIEKDYTTNAETVVGNRLAVTIGPVQTPFNAAGFARMSATVTAIDTAGNASDFPVRGVAERVDDAPPASVPLPPGPQHTSYPDARGRAWYRIPLDTPEGNTTRVLRASQNALLTAAAIPNEAFEKLDAGGRVIKLKELAKAHPQVFTPDHELPYAPSVKEHTLMFSGIERGWTVAAVQQTSMTGVEGTWPTDADCFAVIAVRRPVVVPIPRIIRTKPGDRSAGFLFAPDAGGPTTKIRLYRTRDAEKATEIRTMAPVQEIAASGTLEITDLDLLPDVRYFYRAVAFGPGVSRSEPTAIVAVTAWSSVPPPAPKLLKVEMTGFASLRKLTFEIVRSDYRLTVFRRAAGRPDWELIGADLGPSSALDLSKHTTVRVAGGWRVELVDMVPEPAATYVYKVQMRDPRERVAESAAVEESP
jgi:hypothetical protein